MHRVLLASLNTALERLLVCDRVVPGTVHTLAEDYTLAGGKGVNSSRVMAQLNFRMGGEPVIGHLVGFLGGGTGRLVVDALAAEQLSGTWVESDSATRVNEILVDRSNPFGATVFNAKGGPVGFETWGRLDQAFRTELETASGLVCSGSIPPGVQEDCYGQWIDAANSRNRWSLLDSHGAALSLAAQRGPTIIKINRDELAELDKSETNVIRGWQNAGTRAIIITDGGNPVLASTPVGDFELGPPSVEIVSAVGSGDAFTAGLLFELERNSWTDWERALRLAAACGAANAMSLTARLADEADIESLFSAVDITRTTSIASTT